MFPSLEDNDNLYFATKSEVLNKGLMEQLNGFVEVHKNTKMIIIDTLQKIKDNVRDSSNYENDYDIIAKLKNFADKYNICLLIVHHTRKQESNDSFDMISGTQWEIKRMAYDFKKDSKEFYRSKNKPEIVNVPKANYIAVRGSGDPNEEGGAYQQAISVLYAVAYTLKMSYKTDYKIKGFYEYVVPPLEGFWWQENVSGVDYSDKSAFCWISVIRVPDFVSEKDFDWAVKMATNKKKISCSSAEFVTIEEGLCVQIMHIGPFDEETKSVAIMDEFLEENGYVNDINEERLHHEIYLSDARKIPADKWKTIIRHPIKKLE